MIIAGLTGSIGMGKSTTAAMFADEGAPVFDADAAVHALYEPGGAAVDAVGAAFPGVVREGRVDRAALGAEVRGNAEAFARLEAIVHPLVAAERRAFLDASRAKGAPVAILDIPLLFETGGDKDVDAVIVVSAPAKVQRERVLARPGMTESAFEAILARQTPDSVKRARADWVIDTSRGFDEARAQVRAVLAALAKRAREEGSENA
ncbi:MAG: dephospho-CoA kinase [Caulobacterales bacterium]|nr:dephospho-CoA kinase [Caulobacterales bacterium]